MATDLSEFTIIKEGEAEILMHAKNEVFFNKTQALSASELKSLRYACQVEGVGQVVALDNYKGKNHSVNAQPEDQPGVINLAKEPVLEANSARAVAFLSKAQDKKVARFLPNPERHWGPKLRAGRQITSKNISLLGAEAVNGALSHTDSEESKAKRPKVEDEPAPNQ